MSEARRALRAARARYRRLPAARRPALNGPISCCGLFTAAELVALAQAGRWPLGERDLDYLRRPRTQGRQGRMGRLYRRLLLRIAEDGASDGGLPRPR